MLHIINQSPFESRALASCLRLAESNSAILLIENAVVAAVSPVISGLTLFTVYALKSDLQARGLLDKVAMLIQVTDYNGFVELTVQHSRIQSWL